VQPRGARATLRSVCTRHDIYVVLESAKRSATGSGVSRHVGKTAATGWHRGSGHCACGQRAVPPESNAVPIRNPAASACPSRPFRASFLLCLTHCQFSHPGDAVCPAHTLMPLQMCGCPARDGRRAGREVASVLRWCGVGCRWAVGALPSDEEDRHSRHGRHHQQFRSVRAFHRLRLFGFSRRWFPAPGLGHWAPDRLSVLMSNSRARTRGAPSLHAISHFHVTQPLSG